MLLNLKNILEKAYKNKYAVPAFNVDNYEMMKAIVQAGEEKLSPIILMFTDSAIKYYGLENLIAVGTNLACQATIPVALHIDHQPNLDVCKKAINLGITSVMYDGSHLPYDDNLKNTKSIIAYAQNNNRDVSFEAELGQISGAEDWKVNSEVIYADPKEAKNFYDNADIACLAIAIGTAHGWYKSLPKLNIDLLIKINSMINRPLVLHGGSGLSKEQIQECITNGMAKVNFGTEIKMAFASGCKNYILKQENEFNDVRKMLNYGMESLKKTIFEKIEICRSGQRYA